MGLLKKIIGLPNAALRGAAEHLAVRWLRDGAAGEHGPTVAAILNALKGKKTLVGFLLGAAAFMAYGIGDAQVATWLGTASGVLVSIGVLDKAVQTVGRPDFLANSVWYRLLADNAGTVATALTAGFAYVNGAACTELMIKTLTLSCAGQSKVLLLLTLFLIYIGVLDTGFLSKTSAQVKR